MSETTASQRATNQTATYQTAPRSVVNAVGLALILPGLGHWYCGHFIAGLVWAVVSVVGSVISLWLLAHQYLVIAWIPSAAVMLIAALDTFVKSGMCPTDYRLQPWNRWYAYVLLVSLSSAGSVGYSLIIKEHYVEAFVIPTLDMSPTLEPGDRILVNKAAYLRDPVQRGDVIIFANPAKPRMTYVKRVIALAGETIEIRDGQLLVNDEPVDHKVNSETPDFGPETVPRFNCFVLGDNLNNSRDSRNFGPIPLATVRGKATVVYWPQYHRIGPLEPTND